MVTKELLKKEIDNVQDAYLVPLYKIIKTFEEPDEFTALEAGIENKKEEWKRFVEKFAGCLADTPIERGDQGKFEIREELK